jgi:hypothetical protein
MRASPVYLSFLLKKSVGYPPGNPPINGAENGVMGKK